MSDELDISISRRDGVAVVSPRGDVDMSASPVLRESLRTLTAERQPRIVVDLAGVAYMDSSGVATLVEAMKNIRGRRGTLVLCNMSERVRGIFEIARLDQYFLIHDSLDGAIGAA